ncbi:metallophosphoesterase [Candidatus Woesearchaeota archaeon]|nr:metallophosphoesterase [Candidatus Woesearchaeota archaeon]
MEISKNIEIIDLTLYLKKQKILVFSDFHIGYEEAIAKQGILMPRFQFKDTMQRLENIFKRVKPKTIIVNGDIKHEFGDISEQEWRETLKLLDYLSKNSLNIILIKGNHDTILGPIAKKRNINILDQYFIDDILILHGNKLPEDSMLEGIKTIITGHEHPAITLKEGSKVEKFKCFLKGKYKGRTLIVQPSFNLVTEGTDVMSETLLSPFLQKSLDDFEVWVIADKEYYFGKIENL